MPSLVSKAHRVLTVLALSFVVLAAAVGCRSTSTPDPIEPAAELDSKAIPAAQTAEPAPAPPAISPAEPAEMELDQDLQNEALASSDDEASELDKIQQEALDACDSADLFLDEGHYEDAIAALDRAYELMLRLPGEGELAQSQEKDDLRRLISDRLARVFASQLTAASEPRLNWDLEIEVISNEQVEREIRSFQTAERDRFVEAYRRSGLYRPMILARLAEAGLPSQLSWLPLIESEFKDRAYSRAKALGMWQFIRSTAARFGLRRDEWIDERMDPVKSTDAAINYLIELHDLFGDWPKALAGYNCGEHRVLRLLKRQPNLDLDFWEFYAQLPRETRRYVPRFFATLRIVEDPAAHGFDLPEPLPPLELDSTVRTTRCLKLEDIDSELGLGKGTLRTLNAELRRGATPPRTYELRIPGEHQKRLAADLEELEEWTPPQPQYTTYRVRRGDTLSAIAQRFGTSASAIARSNGIRNQNRIGAGQRLRIPTGVGGGAAASYRTMVASVGPGGSLTYTVRPGDTLWTIAQRFGTTVRQITTDNGLHSSRIQPGLELKIGSATTADGGRSYVVQRGDTPYRIARAHHVSVHALLASNGLSERSTIYPGQVLVIPDA